MHHVDYTRWWILGDKQLAINSISFDRCSSLSLADSCRVCTSHSETVLSRFAEASVLLSALKQIETASSLPFNVTMRRSGSSTTGEGVEVFSEGVHPTQISATLQSQLGNTNLFIH
jgi:hypothetical protein